MKESTRIAAISVLSLLVGTLFLLPHILGTKPRSAPVNSCKANLRQIDGAKDVWMREKLKTTNDIPIDSDLFGTNEYIRTKPTCMAGGVYTLGRVGDRPRCSIPDHNAW